MIIISLTLSTTYSAAAAVYVNCGLEGLLGFDWANV